MTITQDLLSMIEKNEGRRSRGYKCTAGYWTIGIGHNVEAGPPLSNHVIDEILDNDVRYFLPELVKRMPWIDSLDEVRYGVIVDMAFQMGVAGVCGFTTTMRLIKERQFDEAAKNLLLSKYAEQTPARALRNADALRTGVWPK